MMINERKLSKLETLEKFEMFKLKLCVKLNSGFETKIVNYFSIHDRLSQDMNLNEEEKGMLEKVRISDLDLRKIGDNLTNIRSQIKELRS